MRVPSESRFYKKGWKKKTLGFPFGIAFWKRILSLAALDMTHLGKAMDKLELQIQNEKCFAAMMVIK